MHFVYASKKEEKRKEWGLLSYEEVDEELSRGKDVSGTASGSWWPLVPKRAQHNSASTVWGRFWFSVGPAGPRSGRGVVICWSVSHILLCRIWRLGKLSHFPGITEACDKSRPWTQVSWFPVQTTISSHKYFAWIFHLSLCLSSGGFFTLSLDSLGACVLCLLTPFSNISD